MRALLLLATLSCALPGGVAGQVEVVTSFHGYPWGTPVGAIPEVAGTEPVGEKDGLPIYAADVTVLGKPGLAGFYFHPETGGLVEGAYVFALTLQDCHPVWANLVEKVEADYPALVSEARIPSRASADRPVYDTDCEYFVYNAHLETWVATYRNPTPPDDQVELWVKTVERTPRLTVVFRGGAGQAWADAQARRRGGLPGGGDGPR